MALKDELNQQVETFFKGKFETRTGAKVPEADDLGLGKDAVELEGVVLYTDLAESTLLVSDYNKTFAAEAFKAFLNCACRVIRHNDGVITSFDGDRVMAVYIGDRKKSRAAKSALQINWAVSRACFQNQKD